MTVADYHNDQLSLIQNGLWAKVCEPIFNIWLDRPLLQLLLVICSCTIQWAFGIFVLKFSPTLLAKIPLIQPSSLDGEDEPLSLNLPKAFQ